MPDGPFRILILCTGNSARSQMAEAIINRKGGGRVVAESAGSAPVAHVNPLAIDALRDAGIVWKGHAPRGLEGLERERWDAVITVCDNARESCPLFPGHPAIAHWSLTDPAAVEGTETDKRRAFRATLADLTHRIEELLQTL